MTNGHDKIDDIFKQSLENYSLNVSDEMFEKAFAEAQIKPKSSKGFFQFPYNLIISTLIIVPALIISAYTFNIENNQIANKLNNDNSNNEINIPSQNLLSENTIIEKNLINTNLSNEKLSNPEIKDESNQIFNTNSNKNNLAISSSEISNKKQNNAQIIANSNEKKIERKNDNALSQEKIIPNEGINSSEINIANTQIETIVTNQEIKEPISPISQIHSQQINEINLLKIKSILPFLSQIEISVPFSPISFQSDYPPLSKKANAFVEFNSNLSIPYSIIKETNSELSAIVNKRKEALSPSLSYYNFELLGGIKKGSLILKGGIAYSQLKEHTKYGIVNVNPHTIEQLQYNGTPYNYSDGINFYQVDTLHYWHYSYIADSTIHVVDSAMAYDTDMNQVNIYDTIAITKYDSIDLSKLHTKYSIVEIPLYVGYEWNKGKWSYAIQGGIIPAILLKQTGSFYNGSQEVVLKSDLFPMKKFMLFGSVHASVLYYINTRMVVKMGPEFKTSLLSVTDKDKGWSQKWNNFGLKAGIIYYF